ncbi:hypothetical protein ACK3TF_003947 [Chlorella vulgaris]
MQATMDVPASRTTKYMQFKVHCLRDDQATIPLLCNDWLPTPDTAWVTPAALFWSKVMGEGIIGYGPFQQVVGGLVSRAPTGNELKRLKDDGFVGAHHIATTVQLVKVTDMAELMRRLAVRGVSATLACLEDLPPMDGSNQGRGSGSIFPATIPRCLVGDEELYGPYSLAPALAARGTKWGKQLAALEKFKVQPPLNSLGRVSKVGDTSMQLMLRSLEEYVGYAHKCHGVEPSMDLVMQPSMFSKFVAFKQARGNAASTLLRSSQQVSLVVPFVMSGHCPKVQTWSAGHAAQVKQWFSNLKAVFRRESAITPPKRSPLSLAEQWEDVDREWSTFQQQFQESGNVWTNELAGMCHLAGLKVLLSGRYQPPVRIGALRACHQWAHVTGVECVECGDEDCPKNHIEHFEEVVEEGTTTTTTTMCARLHFVHHKNERRQGPAILPVAPEVVEVLTMLEQASRHLAPQAPTIFFSSNKTAYSSEYWSQIGRAALTVGSTPCTARDMRHEFSTSWRDFVDHVPNSVLQMLGSQVEAAAAYLMGNTPAAWDAVYDDNMRARAKEKVLKLYPKFVEDEDCPKNHIEHFEEVVEEGTTTTTTTMCARLHFVHHKNERRQGPAILPVAPEVVEVLTMLEQASRHLAPQAPTIFFSSNKTAYSSEYWSQIGRAALTVGSTPCTARDMRHEFSTSWRDFVDHVPNSVLQMLGSQVEAAAAYLMGNTPAAWDAVYDDNMRARAKEKVLKLYPKFVEDEDCPKNHIEHFEEVVEEGTTTTTTTMCARLHFVHHKNERRQGPAILPVAPEVVEVLTMLEQASRHLAPQAPTIFFSSNKTAYSSEYWSQIGRAALTVGSTPCTARDMRHEFSTSWRDFVDHVPNSVLQMLGSQVEAAAAYLMGNTPAAWDAVYDDNMRARAKEKVLKLYPKFVEYVLAEAARRRQQRPRNPHTSSA